MREGANALARERRFLRDRCRSLQNGDTPLNEAAVDSLSHTPSLSHRLSLSLSLSFSLSFSLGNVEVWYRWGHGCGRGRTHLRGERGCLPDRWPAPQNGGTPLNLAAKKGHAAVAGHLLAAKADVETKDKVRGQGG